MTPLTQEPRATLGTEETAQHLGLKPQTLHSWASKQNGPLRPIKIGGRLQWPVADLRRLVGQ